MKNTVKKAFHASLWLKGEVAGFKESKGNYFLDLVEDPPGQRKVALTAVIWANRWPALERKLRAAAIDIKNGQEMLFQGTVDFWESSGKLVFYITDVSTEFSLGQIEARRRDVLARLRREGLCDLNKRFPLSDLPLRIGIVSARAAKGFEDLLLVLKTSGLGFHVLHHDVPVQGLDMEQAVCKALSLFSAHQADLQLDALCLVRGGGSPSDLGWWNSYAIAAAISRVPFPVFCGIGHGSDRVAVDEVVHQRFATPTAVGQFLVQRIEGAKTLLHITREAVAESATTLMNQHRESFAARRTMLSDLTRVALSGNRQILRTVKIETSRECQRTLDEQATRLAGHAEAVTDRAPALIGVIAQTFDETLKDLKQAASARVGNASRELDELRRSIPAYADLALTMSRRLVGGFKQSIAVDSLQRLYAESRHLGRLKEVVGDMFERAIAQERQRLELNKELVDLLDPTNTLKRGYSITFDENGKSIKDAASLKNNAEIVTLLANGRIRSTVTETSPPKDKV